MAVCVDAVYPTACYSGSGLVSWSVVWSGLVCVSKGLWSVVCGLWSVVWSGLVCGLVWSVVWSGLWSVVWSGGLLPGGTLVCVRLV